MPKRKQLLVGVVGGGINSAVGRAHLTALNMDGLWKIQTGVFSREPEANRKSAEFWGIEYPCKSFDAFCETARNLDAILLLTPTPQHYEQIVKLSGLGLPIISEKSLTTNLNEAIELQKYLKAQLHVTFNYTGYPMVREISARINSGKYGQVHTIEISMPQEGFLVLTPDGLPKKIQDWRTRDYDLPTISLDLGVHVTSLIELLVGRLELESIATERHVGRISNTIDSVSAISKTKNGLEIRTTFGKVFAGNRNGLSIKVFGDMGSVCWKQEFPNELSESDVFGSTSTIHTASIGLLVADSHRYMRFKPGHPTGFIEAFANYYSDIYDSITDKEGDYNFGIQSAIWGLDILTTFHSSANSGRWESSCPLSNRLSN